MGERNKPRDEAGRFVSPDRVVIYREITVWDMREGDVLKVLRGASEKDRRSVEEQYDEPWHSIQVEEIDAL